jgi:hypothetical protein
MVSPRSVQQLANCKRGSKRGDLFPGLLGMQQRFIGLFA